MKISQSRTDCFSKKMGQRFLIQLPYQAKNKQHFFRFTNRLKKITNNRCKSIIIWKTRNTEKQNRTSSTSKYSVNGVRITLEKREEILTLTGISILRSDEVRTSKTFVPLLKSQIYVKNFISCSKTKNNKKFQKPIS